jgi:voltage-gated potassium channel
MEITITFIKLFFWMLTKIYPLLLAMIAVIAILGQIAGRAEGWSRFNALYWSFVTATTVGYGDLVPVKKRSKIISILISFIGIMFTGVIVAVTVTTASEAFKENVNPAVLHSIQKRLHE